MTENVNLLTLIILLKVDEECRGTQNVIKERKSVLSRKEVENRIEEGRLQAQKIRLLKRLSSIQ